MLPIGDKNPTRTTPFVNYCLLALNIAVFVLELRIDGLEGGRAWLVPGYGLVPTRIMNDVPGEAFTIFSSMFMHGGWLHLAGNMLFLYIFGDNVEDALGHFRYVLFYLLSGVGAAAAQVLTNPTSPTPMVGASGAIAGVLAAYVVLYPSAPITLLMPPPLLFFVGPFIMMPAWFVIGAWFVIQLWTGFGPASDPETGGVAIMAHVGGFLTGLLLVRPFSGGRPQQDHDRWRGWRPPERAAARGRWG